MKSKLTLFVIAALFVAARAFATAPDTGPEPTPTTIDVLAEADAEATSQSLAALRARLAAESHSTGNGSVDVQGDRLDHLSLAVGNIRANGGPETRDECKVTTRGGDITVASLTGGTKVDETCAKRLHCLRLADRLASWGYTRAAAAQLTTCEGVTVSEPARAATTPQSKGPVNATQLPATQADLAKLQYETDEKIKRAFEQRAGK